MLRGAECVVRGVLLRAVLLCVVSTLDVMLCSRYCSPYLCGDYIFNVSLSIVSRRKKRRVPENARLVRRVQQDV